MRGRKPKYLTVERFENFIANDHAHLIKKLDRLTDKVATNSKLLWILLSGLIAAALMERLL